MLEIKILTAQRAVTASGTPEKIKEAYEQEKNRVISIRIRAKTDNAGDIYITYDQQRSSASTEGDIIAPGELWTLDIHWLLDGFVDLSKIWIDAANSGDEISYTALEVV